MSDREIINILNNYNGIFAREYDLTEEEFVTFQDSTFDFLVKEIKREYYEDYDGKKALIVYKMGYADILVE